MIAVLERECSIPKIDSIEASVVVLTIFYKNKKRVLPLSYLFRVFDIPKEVPKERLAMFGSYIRPEGEDPDGITASELYNELNEGGFTRVVYKPFHLKEEGIKGTYQLWYHNPTNSSFYNRWFRGSKSRK